MFWMFWLLKLPFWIVRSRLAVPILGIVAAAQCWMMFQPQPSPLDARRTGLADEVAAKLAESLPVPTAGRPAVVVVDFQRDNSGMVTQAVRRAIERVDRYTIPPSTTLDTTLAKLGFRARALAPEEAISLATEQVPGEYVLAGRVQTLSARSDQDEAVLEAVLIPVGQRPPSQSVLAERPDPAVSSGVVWPVGTVQLSARALHDHQTEGGQLTLVTAGWPARLIGWLALALLLPLAAAPLASRLLERQSNALNLVMLLVLTGIAGLSAFALLGFGLNTVWSAILLAAGVGLALAYNWLILSKLEDLRM